MRVIAGEARGRRLVAPSGARPTTDRAREALFSALGERVVDSVILDLYAGSGAVAIEALSRGAQRAVLVDDDPQAIEACETNLAATRTTERASVHRIAVERFLAAGAPPEAPFDLVYCDPPYDTADDAVAAVLTALAAPGWRAEGARVIVERPVPRSRASEAQVSPWPPGWAVAWERKYGDTLVTMLSGPGRQYMGDEQG